MAMMNTTVSIKCLGVIALLSFAAVSYAANQHQNDTIYIRDTLYVPLRDGQSTEHRILQQALKSGTELTLLESNEETGYSRVETKDGRVGWIPSQYLDSEPSASQRLAELQIKLEKLETEKQYMSGQLTTQSNAHLAAKDSVSKMTRTIAQLQEELASIQNLAASTISIDQRNKALLAEQDSLNDQIKMLIESNDELRDLSAQAWFLRGAAIVFLALFIGFLVARKIYSLSSGGWR
jgi:SH3 domain protein